MGLNNQHINISGFTGTLVKSGENTLSLNYPSQSKAPEPEEDSHENFFGYNIRRVIREFKKK